MPLPHNVHPGTRRSLRGLFSRAFRHEPPAPEIDEPAAPERPRPRDVDSAVRQYWAPRDAQAPDRVAALVHAHENRGHDRGGRPRGNPAFSETLFVELMRAKQFRRAFDHLSADCRRTWGSSDTFAAAQGAAMRRLMGVAVKDVRYLPEWKDERADRRYQDVAELDVEYTLAGRDAPTVIPKVVHLVPDEGKWRSVCYPD